MNGCTQKREPTPTINDREASGRELARVLSAPVAVRTVARQADNRTAREKERLARRNGIYGFNQAGK